MADGKIIIDTEVNSSGAEKGISELSKKAQDGLGTMNKTFLATSAAIGGIGAYAIKVGGDFQEGMSKVQAISGATASEIEKLSNKAKEMGAKTKFSATESAEAMQYMAMAGWKTTDMLNGIDGIMNLAAASGEDLALVSDIVTDALTAFGMSAKDSAQFADLLASAASNSNTNVSMLGESFKYVAPVAGALKMSAKDTAFALGLMANSGIKASQSGTALRASLTNLAHPSKQMAEEMDRLGISLTDSNGKVKEGKALYDELRQKFSGLTDAQKTSSAATIFGKEAMSGMLAIINASDADYKKLYENLSNCDGTAEKMAETMNDNLKGSLVLLGSAVEGAGIAFYEKFSKPAKEAVDNVAEWFSDLTVKLGNGELDNTLSEIATALATVGTGLLAFNVVSTISNLIGVMNKTAEATGLVAKAFKIWDAIMAMSPIGWIVTIIAAVTVGLITLWKTNEGFRNAVIGAWGKIKEVASNVWNSIVDIFKSAVDFIKNNWKGILLLLVNPLAGIFKLLYDNCESFRNFVNDFIQGVKDAFVNGWNNIVSFFTESIPAWWESVKQSFVDGWQAIIDFFTETVPKLIDDIAEWFDKLPYRIGYALGYALTTIVKWGINTCNSFIETCINIHDSVVEWFSKLPTRISEFISNAYTNIVEWGTNTWNNFIQTCTNIYNSTTEWFSKLPGVIWSWLVKAYDNIVNWGAQTYNNMVTSVSNAINGVIDWFSKLPGRILEWLSNTISKVIQFGKDLGSEARNAGSTMVTSIVDAVKDLPSKFMDIGKNIVKGVCNGITSMGGWLGDKVSGFFNGIVDGAKDAMGIHSPSRVMRDLIGKNLVRGIGVGIDVETPNLKKSFNKKLLNAVSSFNVDEITAKMTATVYQEQARTSRAMTSGVNNMTTSTNIITNENDNGLTLKIDKFINNTKQDVKNIAEELEFYRKQNNLAKGRI